MYDHPFHTKDLKHSSFLVTGGAGFIGSHLVEYLMKYGAGKIRVLDNLSNGFLRNIEPFLSSGNFEFIEGDITNLATCRKACNNINYVLHQAALGSVPRSLTDPLATHTANATGFLHMLIAARDANVTRLVYASSSSVYGDDPALPKKESSTGSPLSPYAVSKMTNELYAHVFASHYHMQIIGLRYFNIFGPRQDPQGPYAAAIPVFAKAILLHQSPFINGDGEQSRDFTFVENAVQANIKALFTENHEALNKVYNVAVGKNISVNKLFENIREYLQADIKPIHRAERQGDIKNSLADISEAKRLLDYHPDVMIKEGLALTLEWMKQQMYAGYTS